MMKAGVTALANIRIPAVVGVRIFDIISVDVTVCGYTAYIM